MPKCFGTHIVARLESEGKKFTKSIQNTSPPPRMRGTLIVVEALKRGLRITPACAGKTEIVYGNCMPWEDHPRVCGENGQASDAFKRACGSPPRVRGKPCSPLNQFAKPRITPACAGKTLYYVALESNRFAQNVNVVECLSRIDEWGIF